MAAPGQPVDPLIVRRPGENRQDVAGEGNGRRDREQRALKRRLRRDIVERNQVLNLGRKVGRADEELGGANGDIRRGAVQAQGGVNGSIGHIVEPVIAIGEALDGGHRGRRLGPPKATANDQLAVRFQPHVTQPHRLTTKLANEVNRRGAGGLDNTGINDQVGIGGVVARGVIPPLRGISEAKLGRLAG